MPSTNELILRPAAREAAKPRRYARWTTRELEFAFWRRMAGFADQAIADELGRTCDAVKWQLRYV